MNKGLAIVLLAASAIAFAFGVVWLFELRFEAGDVYPPYSSLRSDPLGAMALYESLENMPGLTVQRDFSSSNELPETPNTAYLQLGGRADEWKSLPNDLYREIAAFVSRGGRLVIAFYPETHEPFNFPPALPGKTDAKKSDSKKDDAKKSSPDKPEAKDKKTPNTGDEEDDTTTLKDKWGVTFGFVALANPGNSQTPDTVANVSGLPLPATLDWHSGMVFSDLDKSWKTIYARGPDAVVIARQFGPGSVVMVADSYFFSNEALRKDRHTDLLAWLIGPNKQVMFDEAHFGIVESPGVMALVRQYHLVGLVAGLFLLAVLFVWKNISSLVPPAVGVPVAGDVLGKDAASGFVNLLRRNIPAQDVLGVCVTEWKKSSAGARPSAKLAEIQSVLEAENSRSSRQRQPVEAYRRIATILKQPTFKPAPSAPQPPPL